MAKTKQPTKSSPDSFQGFVNYNPSAEELRRLKETPMSDELLVSQLVRMVEADYKVTFSYDDKGRCHTCFFVPRLPGMDNYGWILAGRGSTPMKALKQALYIHHNVFDGVWGKDKGTFGEIDD